MSAPRELVELQRRFTEMLRTPLSTRTGTFAPDVTHCDPELIAAVQDDTHPHASARLGVYQRQYWLRLFNAMQLELPLSARLIGLFRFNQLSQAYLLAHAPTAHDLGRVADSFPQWLQAHPAELTRRNITLPKLALHQALALDTAWQRVWMAPAQPPWKPSAEQATQLATARLIPTSTFALLEEDWPLMELRKAVHERSETEHLELPRRLGTTRHWALVRTERGLAQLRLEPRQARLYAACTTMPLSQAITRLQSGCSRKELDALAAHVQQWFALSMELGFWSGARP